MSTNASAKRRPFWIRFLRGLGEALFTLLTMALEFALPFVFVGLGEATGGGVGTALTSFGVLLFLLLSLYHSIAYLLKKGDATATQMLWRVVRDNRAERTAASTAQRVGPPSRLSLRDWIVLGMPAGRAPSAELDAAVAAPSVDALNLTTAEAIVLNGLLDREAMIYVPINPPEGQSTTDARRELHQRGVIRGADGREEIAPTYLRLVGVALLGSRATDVSVRSEDGARRTTAFVRTPTAAVMAEYSTDPADLSGYRLTAVAPASVPERIRALIGIDPAAASPGTVSGAPVQITDAERRRLLSSASREDVDAAIKEMPDARDHTLAIMKPGRTIDLTDFAVGLDRADGVVRSASGSLKVLDHEVWIDEGEIGKERTLRRLTPKDALAWVDDFVA